MMQYKLLIFTVFLAGGIFGGSFHVYAQSAEELQSRIGQRNDTIKQLEEEIKKYQIEIEALGKEASSLKNTIAGLDLTKKKLETDIKVTQNKIDSTNLQIKQLSLDISDKSERITESKRVIAQSLANIDRLDSNSLFEHVLGANSLTEAWHSTEELNILQAGIIERIKNLQTVKVSLEGNKKATEAKKAELLALQKDLSVQQRAVTETTKEKNAILAETKNSEATYSKLLAANKKQIADFEREVDALEAALKIIIDPSSLPTGKGVLQYPLDKVKITQYFGNTPFASKNPQVYKGSSGEHNGVDFAASIGTPVKASATGVVSNVINTRLTLKCGYGNWISIKHPNGLTTLYAHLSATNVSVGQTVYPGETIGYSGNTGFTTGPHLHFGVYATEGFKVTQSSSCSRITIPYASLNAYLNPLSFF